MELIVVLTILAILAALLIPALTGYIRKAKEKAIIKKSIDTFKIKMLICILSLIEDDKYEFINKIDGYKENVDYSKITDEVLKFITTRNID